MLFAPAVHQSTDVSVWVAPVCTAVVGVVAVVAAWLTARGARKHAEKMVRETREADAYRVAITMAERVGYWVQTSRPLWETEGYKPTPLPSTDDQAAGKAGLMAFGNQDVIDAWNNWSEIVAEMYRIDRVLSLPREELPEEYPKLRERITMVLQPPARNAAAAACKRSWLSP